MVNADYNADYPPHEEVRVALLDILFRHGGPTATLLPPQAYDLLADRFALTDEQRTRRRGNSDDFAWKHRVQWARRRLLEMHLVTAAQRGTWTLTDAGRKAAAELPAPSG
jgi:hypothetical protein